MLDNETKKIIDTSRDILVGKLPAPNSQVEQITLAMLYKFMDDIDQEVIEFGGKAKYFTGIYEKYSWRTIMRKSVGAQGRMNLYIEALNNFMGNEQLPDTFREIFKKATVPFRDPEILTMFLTEINKMDYSKDSEQLGDAYEYLLSVLGSQGGLGQFRTPRHIIDYIVDEVDPLKTDKILDPSCGTAGFLISGYKHIIAKEDYVGISYDEKSRILSNITGYDIEPSMVKIAKMNMYLHGCASPDISEYDSLTFDDYWNEKFDVILANPPFMTPKGGISPHNKFRVKAKRAEVLFVDYILEHLRPNGRAGIIVPDSILFNPNANFYEVRKMLVEENNVYAVVSLPSGVFLPYSEVKTSILFIDKKIASLADNIIFVDIQSDGYSLGNARNERDDSDLVWAKDVISDWKKAVLENKEYVVDTLVSDRIKVVSKETIKDNRCYLMSKKYRNINVSVRNYDFVRLGDILEESKERVGKGEQMDAWSVSNRIGFVRGEELFSERVASEDVSKYKKVLPGYFAYNPARINVGSIAYNDSDETGCVSPMYTVFKVKNNCKINLKYLYAILKSNSMVKEYGENAYGSVRQQLRFSDLSEIFIPVLGGNEEKGVVQKIINIDERQKEINSLTDELNSQIDNLFD